MKVYLVIWDGDAGTNVEHYASNDARNTAILKELACDWTENYSDPLPETWESAWARISAWADYWLVTSEIDLRQPDSAGGAYAVDGCPVCVGVPV